MCIRALQYKGKLASPKAFKDQVSYLHIYHPEDKEHQFPTVFGYATNLFFNMWLCDI